MIKIIVKINYIFKMIIHQKKVINRMMLRIKNRYKINQIINLLKIIRVYHLKERIQIYYQRNTLMKSKMPLIKILRKVY